MATDLSDLDITFQALASWKAVKTLDHGNVEDSNNSNAKESIAYGSGAGQADQIWHDIRLLAATANEDLDLAGSLTNAFGGTVTFANIKGILIWNRSDETLTSPAHTATTAAMEIKGAAANGFLGPTKDASDIIQVATGGWFGWYDPAGKTVTAGTGDLLNVANADGSNELAYDIVIFGDSA